MKKIPQAVLFLLTISFFSCTKNGSNSGSQTVPKGTTIKYEAICTANGDKLGLSYYDAKGNRIGNDNGISGWLYIFTTIQDNTIITLGVVDLTLNPGQVTGRIYVNGTLAKEAKGGSSVTLNYP